MNLLVVMAVIMMVLLVATWLYLDRLERRAAPSSGESATPVEIGDILPRHRQYSAELRRYPQRDRRGNLTRGRRAA